MPSVILYFLFFCSGISGLVYQVVWTRQFGNVFGNTIYSASIVVSLFMLGLGLGSYVAGVWADRHYERTGNSLVRAYGSVELIIAFLGLAVSLLLPHLAALVAALSSYAADRSGWFELSRMSYVARGAVAAALLLPITTLMGGTLTLLIRHRVREDVESAGAMKIAVLYAVNTAGAALGAFLTDFWLVPAVGLRGTQLTAVFLNVMAGAGACTLARRIPNRAAALKAKVEKTRQIVPPPVSAVRSTWWIGAALMVSGFSAMGIEIVWLRHFEVLLGGFRAVFSLVLSVMLAAVAIGSMLGAGLNQRTARPAQALMLVQGAFVASVLLGLGMTSFSSSTNEQSILWRGLRSIVLEIGLPSMLMGCSFPLANAVVQHAETWVGRRAGGLYFANTAGAVLGSLVAGYALLPALGMQSAAAVLAIVAAFAIVPLAVAIRANAKDLTPAHGSAMAACAASALIAAISIGAWLRLPPGQLLRQSLPPLASGERLLTISESVTGIVAVTEVPGRGRGLLTNGHPMSSTALLDQRYMRALAHVPMLAMPHPASALVIGFGVGNTTHALTLHPSVDRVDVADLSRHVLEHAHYFSDTTDDVLRDPRVRVYVNDGRQHLEMSPEHSYDLITLEPPPIAHAGVAALYSREFYDLARSRLKPGGYLSQWLPAYQVPASTSLAMVRAFVDVFPQSVLLSGMQTELLLVGTTAPRIEIEPDRLARALDGAPRVLADLRRLDLGTVTEIAGTFVGSADTLARATRGSLAASDDYPLQEYAGLASPRDRRGGVPASLVDLTGAVTWCPKCFEGEMASPAAPHIDAYLALLDQAYRASAAAADAPPAGRRILGSAYLGAILPDTDAVHNIVGVTLLRQGEFATAADAFREALKRRPDSADANRNLGTALAATGHAPEAIEYLRRAVELAPHNGGAHDELGTLLLERREFAEAADSLRAAVRERPDFAPAHNNFGIALASLGRMPEAIEQFEQAVKLDPQFGEARNNLRAARAVSRPPPQPRERAGPPSPPVRQ
jgi:predicted membrane-bound spermidine synthase/tetratricopeptide (TPR) repeat protein